jgi:hypothetical protein
MRICIFGNSHVAALQDGWDDMHRSYGRVSLEFCASGRLSLQFLRLDQGRLLTDNADVKKSLLLTCGREEVVLGDYDLFLIYGIGFKAPELDLRLSAQAKEAASVDSMNESINMKLCRLVRQGTTAPIYISPRPQEARPSAFPCLPYDEVLLRMRKALPVDLATIFGQPAETLVDGWQTGGKYLLSAGLQQSGRGMWREDPIMHDKVHMNRLYGRIFLTHFLELTGAN